jgi:nitrogenase subunit NifH
MMLSCHSATELIEKKQRGELTSGEKMKLYFHTMLCSACSRYAKQSRFLEQIFKNRNEAATNAEVEEQAKALEKKILLRLDPEQE